MSNPTTFGEASGQKRADASLDSFIGSEIVIVSFETEARTIKGKESKISYLTIEPQKVEVDGKEVEAKLVYTWSAIVADQLAKIAEALKNGPVSAKVSQTRTANGRYLSLS